MPIGEKQVSRGRKGRTGRPRKKSRPSGNNSEETEIETQLEELCASNASVAIRIGHLKKHGKAVNPKK
jgi:hypothetical protein